MLTSTNPLNANVTVTECEPVNTAEAFKLLELADNVLIRFTIEDAEAMGMQPLDLLAERLGVSPNSLWMAAKNAGVLTQLVRTAEELVGTGADQASNLILAQAAHRDQQLFGEHDEREAERFTTVELVAIERLHRLTGEQTPLVTAREYQEGGGIDPQLSDSYRSWITRLETVVCRKGVYPGAADEMGFGELEDISMSSSFSPQCVAGYDGMSDLYMTDPEPIGPWFWTNPHCIVDWPGGKELTNLMVVEACLEDPSVLRDLNRELSDTMRRNKGILGYKVITRRPDTHLAKAEIEVEAIRALRNVATNKATEAQWKTVVDTITDHDAHFDTRNIAAVTKEARHLLKTAARKHLNKAAEWKLWDGVENGVPYTYAEDSCAEIARPEMTISARIIHAIRRKAAKKAFTRTAIAFIDPDVLSEDIRDAIGSVLPTRGDWAIQVWFDPYDCGIDAIEAAAAAPHYQHTFAASKQFVA